LLGATVKLARQLGLVEEGCTVAVDSTGFEGRRISRHYALRGGQRAYLMRRFAKLSAAIETGSHLFVSAKVTKGPTHDVCEAPWVLRDGHGRVSFAVVLMDKGYDSEKIHRIIAEELKAQAWIPVRRFYGNRRRWPKAPYRRAMKRRFDHEAYAQRPQAESAFSRHKRRLGSALRSTSWQAQKRDVAYRILTHNLMIIR
jgi:transposase